jgi:hypothetical protein
LYVEEKFLQAAIVAAKLRGDFQEAENLANRIDGFWDAELLEAIREVCGGDPAALEIVCARFEKWQKSVSAKVLARSSIL